MKYLEQDQPLDQEQQAGQPFVAPGFEEVEAAFNANFAPRSSAASTGCRTSSQVGRELSSYRAKGEIPL